MLAGVMIGFPLVARGQIAVRTWGTHTQVTLQYPGGGLAYQGIWTAAAGDWASAGTWPAFGPANVDVEVRDIPGVGDVLGEMVPDSKGPCTWWTNNSTTLDPGSWRPIERLYAAHIDQYYQSVGHLVAGIHPTIPNTAFPDAPEANALHELGHLLALSHGGAGVMQEGNITVTAISMTEAAREAAIYTHSC
jgi:hypothetical protein